MKMSVKILSVTFFLFFKSHPFPTRNNCKKSGFSQTAVAHKLSLKFLFLTAQSLSVIQKETHLDSDSNSQLDLHIRGRKVHCCFK